MSVKKLCVPMMVTAHALLACSSSDSGDHPVAAAGAAGALGDPAAIGSSGTGGTVAGLGGSGGTEQAGAPGVQGGAGGVAGGGGDSAASGGDGGGGGMDGAAGMGGFGPTLEDLDDFSFFVTSQEAILELAGDENGFGGDLRFGEETGLAGADKICATIAETSMPGSSIKEWRAFLSTTTGGEDGGPVHAIERIGEGPWYDRNGRLVASDIEGLLGARPDGDPQVSLDLPNEKGEPNHAPGGIEVDNHDTLTGSNDDGMLESDNPEDTCMDWTDNTEPLGSPMIGHSWPRNPDNPEGNGGSWLSDHNAQGCLARVNTNQDGGGPQGCNGVGCGGGYGGIYCFALNP